MGHVSSRREAMVLIVEDDVVDLSLLEGALRREVEQVDLHTLYSGNGAQQWAAKHRPDLILLDLSLPGLSGLEVLDQLKGDPRTRPRPVIVLTNSRDPSDIERCYLAHANAYVVKPSSIGDYEALTRLIRDFWLQLSERP